MHRTSSLSMLSPPILPSSGRWHIFILVHLLPPSPPLPQPNLIHHHSRNRLVHTPSSPLLRLDFKPHTLFPFPRSPSHRRLFPAPSPASRRPSHLPGLVDARGCHRSSRLCPTLVSGLPTLIIKGTYLSALRPSSGPPGASAYIVLPLQGLITPIFPAPPATLGTLACSHARTTH